MSRDSMITDTGAHPPHPHAIHRSRKGHDRGSIRCFASKAHILCGLTPTRQRPSVPLSCDLPCQTRHQNRITKTMLAPQKAPVAAESHLICSCSVDVLEAQQRASEPVPHVRSATGFVYSGLDSVGLGFSVRIFQKPNRPS
jgi:hypothetical protein